MILVMGATGNVGGEVVRALAKAGRPVRAMSRRPDAASWPEGVESAAGDLNDPDSVDDALTSASSVFMLAGYPDPPGLLARMKAAGVNRVVLLSTGAVAGGNLDNYVVRFNVVSEAAVRDCGLAWTVLRPSGFTSNALRWLPQLTAGNTIREPFADVPVALIDPFDIGAVAARALTEDGHDGRSYRLTGPRAMPARPSAPDLSRLGAGPPRRLRLSLGRVTTSLPPWKPSPLRRGVLLVGQVHAAVIHRGADVPGGPFDGRQAADDGDDRSVFADGLACSREVPGVLGGFDRLGRLGRLRGLGRLGDLGRLWNIRLLLARHGGALFGLRRCGRTVVGHGGSGYPWDAASN
jgi:uncharacterized protein YbjT (DUF2867 family)